MIVSTTIKIINKAYGYPIINDSEEIALKTESAVIISELGIGAIFEFLSYDVSEYSEVRKTIHARRFYQIFKEIFKFTEFNMESFHKMQAGCIFIVSLSGITRGMDDYEYSGFVLEALSKIGKISSNNTNASLNDKLFYVKSAFEKFSRISLGIYSLQIFTKYGMIMQKINRVHEGSAGRLFIEIVEDISKGQKASEKIDKLLSMEIISPENLDDMINEYIDYAVSDITVQGMVPGSKKAEKANKKLTAEISDEIHDAFSGLKLDVADIYNMNISIHEKKEIFEKEHGKPGIDILFVSLLERYASLYERLWYYEGNSFIKRLNMIFINKVRDMFAEQRKQELTFIKNECIDIIEDGLQGFSVFELEGVLNALDKGKNQFDLINGFNPKDSKNVINELDDFLDSNIITAKGIQHDMRITLGSILGPEGIPKNELKILKDVVYDFDAIMELFTEDQH